MNNLKDLMDPPASANLLQKMYTAVFEPAYLHKDVSIVGFSGSGKTAFLKYLVRNLPNIDGYKPKHLFAVLDLETLEQDKQAACNEMFNEVLSFFGKEFLAAEKETIEKLLANDMDLDIVAKITLQLTHKFGYDVTFVLDNFQLCYESEELLTKYNQQLISLKKTNPMKVSYIFVTTQEFFESDIKALGKLGLDFVYNIVWGKDFEYDSASAACLIRNQEKWNNYTFTTEFKSKLIKIADKDPTCIKIIVTKALRNKGFENAFSNEQNTAKLYELVGKKVLDQRFRRIIYSLGIESIKYLLDRKQKPTEYIANTGLVTLNNLFSYFIENNKDHIEKLSGISKSELDAKEITTLKAIQLSGDLAKIRKQLTGQELILLALLTKNADRIITRDEMAKTIWDDGWESTYSDWALDKVVSRLKAKLKTTEHSIKTVKGKGVIFS